MTVPPSPPPPLLLAAHEKDLGGGFIVRRVLPALAQPAVGPFVFFDHFGPIEVAAGASHDVRPHPHIGLATVTYLFEGAMVHRDSIGAVQRIEPGAINWMTAGRGIVHSERAPDDLRAVSHRMHGLQLWLALPAALEECEPRFAHTPAAALPMWAQAGAAVRVLVGEAFGVRSPVAVASPTLYLDIELAAGAELPLGGLAEAAAIYPVTGQVQLDGQPLPAHRMAVLAAGGPSRVMAPGPARLVLIGGLPLGHRHVWWNFVSSRRERIVQAADDWAAGRFATVPGETEFIPLPAKRPA
jgi:hypothetical protein